MDLTTLNVLDGLIIVTLAWNFIRGFNKGFVEEVISIIGIVISIYASYKLAAPFAGLITRKAELGEVVLSGVFLFLIFFLITKYVAFYINKRVHRSSLGFLNNILGFLFGIIRGVIISSIFVFGVAVASPQSYLIKKSSLGGLAVPVVDRALKILPLKQKKEDPLLKRWRKAEGILWKNFVFRKQLEKVVGGAPPKHQP